MVSGQILETWFASQPQLGNYNPFMARGWESKSVENQQAEARNQTTAPRARLTREAAARLRDRESIRLSRQRVLQQLERAQNPQHRKLLQDELAALDEKLNRLET